MTITRNVVICKETEKAYLFKFISNKKTVWIAKNLVKSLEKSSHKYREVYTLEIDKSLLKELTFKN